MIVVAILGLLAAMAIPGFVRARENSREKVCVNNLRQIDGAKDQYALENGLANGAVVNMSLLEPYIKRTTPLCPVGDSPYNVQAIGTNAVCTSSAAAAHNSAYANP